MRRGAGERASFDPVPRRFRRTSGPGRGLRGGSVGNTHGTVCTLQGCYPGLVRALPLRASSRSASGPCPEERTHARGIGHHHLPGTRSGRGRSLRRKTALRLQGDARDHLRGVSNALSPLRRGRHTAQHGGGARRLCLESRLQGILRRQGEPQSRADQDPHRVRLRLRLLELHRAAHRGCLRRDRPRYHVLGQRCARRGLRSRPRAGRDRQLRRHQPHSVLPARGRPCAQDRVLPL